MDGLKNFLPLSRDIQNHWIYKDSEYLHVWIEMLFRARYSTEPKKDIYDGIIYTINYGEFIFGRPSWSKKLGISEQRLKTFIKKMEQENMIAKIKKYSKFTIYLIVNYEKFNQQSNQHINQQDTIENTGIQADTNQHSNQQDNQQLTSSQPATNQQPTNKEESNIDNIEKKDNKDIYKDQIDEVWNYYLSNITLLGITRKKTESKLKHIRARLVDKFTVDQLKQVIDKVFKDPWMMGDNKEQKMYIEIDNFFRNTEKVEKWLARGATNGRINKTDIKPKSEETETEGDRLARRAIEKYGDTLGDIECDF